MNLIISGYGRAPDKTIGLYEVTRGRFTGHGWSDDADAPAFVCKGDGFVFAASETGTHSAYYIYRDGKRLDCIHLEGCAALCHIAYSPKHKTLYGACYGSGNIRSASVNVSDGCFTGDTQDYVQGGRVHSVLLTGADALYAANIAQDCVYVYGVDNTGSLSLSHKIETGKGRGPRHMSFSADERLLYVITEYSNEILVIETETKRMIQVISTLPEPTKETSHCSALCFSPGFDKLYGANRFTDTIAEFDVAPDGTLQRSRWFGCGGHIPRHMTVLSDGIIAVCNQESNSVDLIDAVSGEKTDTLEFYRPAGIIEI
ncbi:MAG: beta-propeller fold lactonase family protein [Eubacteriales bacterium]|jgi:6-phosphogluconolactonase|nr:beta-propeller fold lactonase family protein [Eubacteriales bacterium]